MQTVLATTNSHNSVVLQLPKCLVATSLATYKTAMF